MPLQPVSPGKLCCALSVLTTFLSLSVPAPLSAQKGGATPAQPAAGAGAQGGSSTPYFETQMLAYGGVNQLSETVAEEVCRIIEPKSNPTIVIFDQSSFQNLQAWQSFITSALVLEKAYGTLLEADVAEQAVTSSSGKNRAFAFIPITSGQDLASLITALASSTTNTASAFTIQDSTMAVSLAHQFLRDGNCHGVNLVYYPLFGGYVDPSKAGGLVTGALEKVNALRNYIQLNVTFSSNNDPRFVLFNDLNTQYDQLLKSISSSPGQGQASQTGGGAPNPAGSPAGAPTATSPSSSPGASSLIQGAELNELLFQDNTYVLYADVAAAGGTQRDRKNIITLITGDWISYSGGLIINVALINSKDTSLKLSDTLRYRTSNHHISPPIESGNVENTKAGDNEASICGKEKRLAWWQSEKDLMESCAVPEPAGGASGQPPPSKTKQSNITLEADPSMIGAGGSARLTITINAQAPKGGGAVTFAARDPHVTITPSSVTIPEGGTTGAVTIHSSSVSGPTRVNVSGTYGADSANAIVLINPPVYISRKALVSGDSASAQVTSPDVIDSDRTIDLTASSGIVALDEPTVTIAAQSNVASFGFTAGTVTAPTQVTITATSAGHVVGASTVTVSPVPKAP